MEVERRNTLVRQAQDTYNLYSSKISFETRYTLFDLLTDNLDATTDEIREILPFIKTEITPQGKAYEITTAASKVLEAEIGFHREGLTCPQEFLNKIIDIGVTSHNALAGVTCEGALRSDCILHKCPAATGKPTLIKEKKPMKHTFGYYYTLKLPTTKQLHEEEVSRVLDAITSNEDSPISIFDVIDETQYTLDDSEDTVIKTMLKMLVMSGESHVVHCFDCAKYMLSQNPNEAICAYDSVGKDAHQIFRIIVEEKDQRLFLGIWGDGYEADPGRQTKTAEHGIEFFTEDVGYNPIDIALIESLKVGESWSESQNPEFHVVVRVR